MQALLEIVLPVFVLLGFGYAVRWRGILNDGQVDALMTFAQNIALPCLLFLAIAGLDLGAHFHARLLLSYYVPATCVFALGIAGARLLFARPWEDSVAIGFCALFANSLLLGLPITERAYGSAALAPNFAIVAIHAPFCYGLGITTMEIVRARGLGLGRAAGSVLRAMFSNALVIGIGLGFVVNLGGLPVPGVVDEALAMMREAALPVALFGLGGVLYRYRPEGDRATIAMVCVLSLIVCPALVWGMGRLLDLGPGELRSAVITAAMAPGGNAYLFANIYGVARRVAASSVLAGTAASIVTTWLWLMILP